MAAVQCYVFPSFSLLRTGLLRLLKRTRVPCLRTVSFASLRTVLSADGQQAGTSLIHLLRCCYLAKSRAEEIEYVRTELNGSNLLETCLVYSETCWGRFEFFW